LSEKYAPSHESAFRRGRVARLREKAPTDGLLLAVDGVQKFGFGVLLLFEMLATTF